MFPMRQPHIRNPSAQLPELSTLITIMTWPLQQLLDWSSATRNPGTRCRHRSIQASTSKPRGHKPGVRETARAQDRLECDHHWSRRVLATWTSRATSNKQRATSNTQHSTTATTATTTTTAATTTTTTSYNSGAPTYNSNGSTYNSGTSTYNTTPAIYNSGTPTYNSNLQLISRELQLTIQTILLILREPQLIIRTLNL